MLYALLEKETAVWYLFDFSTFQGGFLTVCIWLTLLLAVAFAVAAFTVKGDIRPRFLKASLIGAICYAVVLGVCFLCFELSEAGKDGTFLLILFLPLAILILAVGGSAVAVCLKRSKAVYAVCGAVCDSVNIGIFVLGQKSRMNLVNS